VAIRNANDGISLAQVAEGSLTEIGNNLQRVRELSVQASNATNSASDRKALQAEVTQLVSEIDRVAKQSDFNGTKLLDGSFSSQLFQVGANAGQAIAIDKVVDAKTNALGGAQFATATVAKVTGANNTDVAIDAFSITDSKGTEVKFDALDVKSVGTAAQNEAAAGKAMATHINAKIGETGVYAEADATGAVTLTSVKDSVDKDGVATVFSTDVDGAGTVTMGTKQFADAIDVSTVKGAQQALEIVDKALGAINSTRADLGAIQNRFTSVVANLQTSTENLSASRSRIRDTDFAKETAELTRTQILQQAGTAMLAQANQVPQNVLSLLR
ncbi:flagellin, partial [Stenotrophomonas sp.]|uniref:flagellin n=1 Tax=Stenotrophomonas sp. TaxID=69392 RepID=UPI00289DAEED